MGYWTDFDYFEIAKISGIGGLIGVLFTIPLRRALIVEAELQYPEGVATAEVLKAGDHSGENDDSSKNLSMIFKAALFGGLMKLAQQGLQMWNSAVDFALPFFQDRQENGPSLDSALNCPRHFWQWDIL